MTEKTEPTRQDWLEASAPWNLKWAYMVRDQVLLTGFVQERAAKETGETEEYEDSEHLQPTSDVDKAEIVSSKTHPAGLAESTHKPVIDVDFPVLAIESSTRGHSHLYIDKELTWTQYVKLLRVMTEVGLVEEGYLAAAERRGCTHLRVPWLKKRQQENGSYR